MAMRGGERRSHRTNSNWGETPPSNALRIGHQKTYGDNRGKSERRTLRLLHLRDAHAISPAARTWFLSANYYSLSNGLSEAVGLQEPGIVIGHSLGL